MTTLNSNSLAVGNRSSPAVWRGRETAAIPWLWRRRSPSHWNSNSLAVDNRNSPAGWRGRGATERTLRSSAPPIGRRQGGYRRPPSSGERLGNEEAGVRFHGEARCPARGTDRSTGEKVASAKPRPPTLFCGDCFHDQFTTFSDSEWL
jgi:hypothetical protein